MAAAVSRQLQLPLNSVQSATNWEIALRFALAESSTTIYSASNSSRSNFRQWHTFDSATPPKSARIAQAEGANTMVPTSTTRISASTGGAAEVIYLTDPGAVGRMVNDSMPGKITRQFHARN